MRGNDPNSGVEMEPLLARTSQSHEMRSTREVLVLAVQHSMQIVFSKFNSQTGS
jgi:hypothetical protein